MGGDGGGLGVGEKFLYLKVELHYRHQIESAFRWAAARAVFNVPFIVDDTSVRGGNHALGKAHMRSTPSHRKFPSIAFETVPIML